MSGPVDLDLVKAMLTQRIDALVQQLYPAAVRDGRHWRLGSVAGEPGQSLAIAASGNGQGLWKDFSADVGGGPLDLIAHAQFNGRVDAEVVRWAVEWCGLGRMSGEDQARAAARAADSMEKQAQQRAADTAKRIRQARAIWLHGRDMAGTPVDHYLQGRAIDCGAAGHWPRALRFDAEVYNSETRTAGPAMLAYVYGAEAQGQTAVHRTWLRRDDAGRWRKDWTLREAKKTLGPFGGGYIPIWRGAVSGPLHALPAGTWIATAEGIENALSVAVARPHLRVIAHISLTNLSALDLPDCIAGLYVAADNDKPGSPAAAAFEQQLARLNERGIAHEIVRAPDGHKDMNDWLQALRRAEPSQEGMAS